MEQSLTCRPDLLSLRDAALHFAFRICGRLEDAEDIVQDAYLRIARFKGEVPIGDGGRRWLFRTVLNTARDHRRSGKRRELREQEAIAERVEASHGHTDTIGKIENADLHSAVQREIQQLDQTAREVISLHYEQGLPYSEVSEVLNVPEGTLRCLAFRSIAALRERLASSGRAVSSMTLLGALKFSPALTAKFIVGKTSTVAVCATVALTSAGAAKAAAGSAFSFKWITSAAVLALAVGVGARTVTLSRPANPPARTAPRAVAMTSVPSAPAAIPAKPECNLIASKPAPAVAMQKSMAVSSVFTSGSRVHIQSSTSYGISHVMVSCNSSSFVINCDGGVSVSSSASSVNGHSQTTMKISVAGLEQTLDL